MSHKMWTESLKYDVRQTCRSCLGQSDEMISLNEPPGEIAAADDTFTTHKTTGEVMMECANVEVSPFI